MAAPRKPTAPKPSPSNNVSISSLEATQAVHVFQQTGNLQPVSASGQNYFYDNATNKELTNTI
jgi:hypothetical protein